MSYIGPYISLLDDLDETTNNFVVQHPEPYANYTSATVCNSGETIAFTNTSINPWSNPWEEPVNYIWTIGSIYSGGTYVITGQTSYFSPDFDADFFNVSDFVDLTNIAIKFITNGDYFVNLRANNSYGHTDHNVIVSVGEPTANFIFTGSTQSGSTIHFTDTSIGTPTIWSWSVSGGTYQFTGSTNGNSENPIIILKQDKTYSITLKATNLYGSASVTKNIIISG